MPFEMDFLCVFVAYFFLIHLRSDAIIDETTKDTKKSSHHKGMDNLSRGVGLAQHIPYFGDTGSATTESGL